MGCDSGLATMVGPVELGEQSKLLTLQLPVHKPPVTVPVVELYLK